MKTTLHNRGMLHPVQTSVYKQLKTRLDKDLTQLTENTDNEVSRKIKNSDLMTDLKLLSVYSLYLLIFTKLAQTLMQLCTSLRRVSVVVASHGRISALKS